MSLSRAELEAMDRDELIDELTGMDRRLSDLQSVVFETLKPQVDDLQDRVDELEAENQRLRERLDDVDATAKGAHAVANGDSGDRSKTDIAQELTRDLLVKKVAQGTAAQDRPVTVSDIQNRAEPEHELAWAIVDRAWSKLQAQWPQFYETTDDGDQALSVRPDEITPALAKTVGESLSRPDLTKRFVGDNGGERP